MDKRNRHLSGVLGALMLTVMCTQAGAAEQGQTAAVLKRHEVSFNYRSSVAPLSCTELQGRVAAVFRALGAREDVDVRASNCDAFMVAEMPGDDMVRERDPWRSSSDPWDSSDPWQSESERARGRFAREQLSHVRVSLLMPVEVTPEVLEEIKKDKSRRELVSRVTGNPAASLDEPIVFPARRQEVTLSRRTLDLEPEDCELIDQMSTSVFKKLGLRVVGGRPSCDRRRLSHIPPKVTVEALMPIMPTVPTLTPPAGESESDPSG